MVSKTGKADSLDSFFQSSDWDLDTESFSFLWEDNPFVEAIENVQESIVDTTTGIVEEITEDPAEYLWRLVPFTTAAEHIYNWDFVDTEGNIKTDNVLETVIDIGLGALTVIPGVGAAVAITKAAGSKPLMGIVKTAIKGAGEAANREALDKATKVVAKTLTDTAKKFFNKKELAQMGIEIAAESAVSSVLDTVAQGKELTWEKILEEVILTAPENIVGKLISQSRKEAFENLSKLSKASRQDIIDSEFKDISKEIAEDSDLFEPVKEVIAGLFIGDSANPTKISELLLPGAKGKSKTSILYRVLDEAVSAASRNVILTRLNPLEPLSTESLLQAATEGLTEGAFEEVTEALSLATSIGDYLESSLSIINEKVLAGDVTEEAFNALIESLVDGALSGGASFVEGKIQEFVNASITDSVSNENTLEKTEKLYKQLKTLTKNKNLQQNQDEIEDLKKTLIGLELQKTQEILKASDDPKHKDWQEHFEKPWVKEYFEKADLKVTEDVIQKSAEKEKLKEMTSSITQIAALKAEMNLNLAKLHAEGNHDYDDYFNQPLTKLLMGKTLKSIEPKIPPKPKITKQLQAVVDEVDISAVDPEQAIEIVGMYKKIAYDVSGLVQKTTNAWLESLHKKLEQDLDNADSTDALEGVSKDLQASINNIFKLHEESGVESDDSFSREELETTVNELVAQRQAELESAELESQEAETKAIDKILKEILPGFVVDVNKLDAPLPTTKPQPINPQYTAPGKSTATPIIQKMNAKLNKVRGDLITLPKDSIVSRENSPENVSVQLIEKHAALEVTSYQPSLQKMQLSLDEFSKIRSALESELEVLEQIANFTADLKGYYKVSDDPKGNKAKQSKLEARKLALERNIASVSKSWRTHGNYKDFYRVSDAKLAEVSRQKKVLRVELESTEKDLQEVSKGIQVYNYVKSKLAVFEVVAKVYLQKMSEDRSYHWLANSVREALSKKNSNKSSNKGSNKGSNNAVREALDQLSILRTRLRITLEQTNKQYQDVIKQRANYLAAQLLNMAVRGALTQMSEHEAQENQRFLQTKEDRQTVIIEVAKAYEVIAGLIAAREAELEQLDEKISAALLDPEKVKDASKRYDESWEDYEKKRRNYSADPKARGLPYVELYGLWLRVDRRLSALNHKITTQTKTRDQLLNDRKRTKKEIDELKEELGLLEQERVRLESGTFGGIKQQLIALSLKQIELQDQIAKGNLDGANSDGANSDSVSSDGASSDGASVDSNIVAENKEDLQAELEKVNTSITKFRDAWADWFTAEEQLLDNHINAQLGRVFADYLRVVKINPQIEDEDEDIDENAEEADAPANDSVNNFSRGYWQVQKELIALETSLVTANETAQKLAIDYALLKKDEAAKKAKEVSTTHIKCQKLDRNIKLYKEKIANQQGYKQLLRVKGVADNEVTILRQSIDGVDDLVLEQKPKLKKYQNRIAALEESLNYGIKLIAAVKATFYNWKNKSFMGRLRRFVTRMGGNWQNAKQLTLQSLQEEISELEKRQKEVLKTIEAAAPYSEQRIINMKQTADRQWLRADNKSDPYKKRIAYRDYNQAHKLANKAKHLQETEVVEIPLRLEALRQLLLEVESASNLIEHLEKGVDNWLLEYSQVKEVYRTSLEAGIEDEEELLGLKNRQEFLNKAALVYEQHLECLNNLLSRSQDLDIKEFNALDFLYKSVFLEEEITKQERVISEYQVRVGYLEKDDPRARGYSKERAALSKDLNAARKDLNKAKADLGKLEAERVLKPVVGKGNLLAEWRELFAVLRNPEFRHLRQQTARPSQKDLNQVNKNWRKTVVELDLKLDNLIAEDGDKEKLSKQKELSQKFAKVTSELTQAQSVVEKTQEALDVYHHIYLPVTSSEISATIFASLLRSQFEDRVYQVRYQPRAVVEYALSKLANGKRDKAAGLVLKKYLKWFEGYQGLKAAILNYAVDPWREETRAKILATRAHKDEGNIEGGFQNTRHQLFSQGETAHANKISAGFGATLLKLFGDASYFTVRKVPSLGHPNLVAINNLDKQLSEIQENHEILKESFNSKLAEYGVAESAEQATKQATTLTRVVDISTLVGDSLTFSFDWLATKKLTIKNIELHVRDASNDNLIHSTKLPFKEANKWQHYEQVLGNHRDFNGFDEIEQLEISFKIRAGHVDNLVLKGLAKVIEPDVFRGLEQKREDLLNKSNEQNWHIQYSTELPAEERKWLTQLLADVGLQEGDNPIKQLMPDGVLNLLDPDLFYLDNLPDGTEDIRTAREKHAEVIARIEENSGEVGLAKKAESVLIRMGKRKNKGLTKYSTFWNWLIDLDPVADLSEELEAAESDLKTVLDRFSEQFQPLFENVSREQEKINQLKGGLNSLLVKRN